MATAAKSKAKKPAPKASVYDVMKLLDATANVDEAQKKFKLAGASYDADARRSSVVSTGMLGTDLFLNGGIYPGGWYGVSGPEGAAKSTGVNTAFISLYYSGVPIIGVYDAEGSTSPEYIETIARTSSFQGKIDITRAFGVRDPKDASKWIVEPRIRYFPESSLEAIWKSQSAILRRLPDKIFIDGKWWLLFDNNKKNISRFKGQGNSKIGGQFGKIAIEAIDGGLPQALFIVDSIAAMISDADDDEDDIGTNALGLEARGHAKQAKKVKGKLKRKHSSVFVTNQIRDKPMAKAWEPQTYEPGGRYLGHAKDATIQQNPRSVPHGSGQLEEEWSVNTNGGTDTYRYICMRTVKNKFGPPFLESWQRIWVSDAKGQGRGFCPVYDTWQYLKNTGQAVGSISDKKTIVITMQDGIEGDLPKLSWLEFKSLILLEGEDLKTFATGLNIDTNPKLRERCFTQIREGDGIDRYFATLHGLGEEVDPDAEMPYDQWEDKDLIEQYVVYELGSKKDAKSILSGKKGKDKLIEALEEYDALPEEEE